VLRTASVEAVRSLVASQLGLALLPDFAYRPWSLEQERVEARAIKEPIPAIDIGLVWRRGSRLDWTAREFIDIARDQSRLRARQHLPARLSLNSRDSGKNQIHLHSISILQIPKPLKIEILIAHGFSYAHGWLTGC
jgi:hypothetical protein